MPGTKSKAEMQLGFRVSDSQEFTWDAYNASLSLHPKP